MLDLSRNKHDDKTFELLFALKNIDDSNFDNKKTLTDINSKFKN